MRLQLQDKVEAAAAETAAVMTGTERTVSRKIKKRIRWKRTSRRKTESRCSSSCRNMHCSPADSDRIVQGPVATQSPTLRCGLFFEVSETGSKSGVEVENEHLRKRPSPRSGVCAESKRQEETTTADS
jgi:hypothetical protein